MSRSSPQVPILVQLVEPRRMVRYGLRVLLEGQPRIRVVNEADSIADALAPRTAPVDIVVLNGETPGALSSLSALAGMSTQTRVVIVTRDAERGSVAMRLGAAATLTIDQVADKLIAVIESVHRECTAALFPGL